MQRFFQPLLWALAGAAMAGGIFFLLNRPDGSGVTIVISSPTAVSSSQEVAGPPETQDTQEALVNINTATAAELIVLPGIGEVKAEAIVAYREQNGAFQRTDELLKVSGIGTVVYQRLRELVTVGG